MPRQRKKHWPLPEDAATDAEDRRDHVVHTLGESHAFEPQTKPFSVERPPGKRKSPRFFASAYCV